MQWYETKAGRMRVEVEKRLMKRRFPQFVLKLDRKNRALSFVGNLRTNLGNIYTIKLTYPSEYLRNPEISVFFLNQPQDLKIPHLYSDKRMCLFESVSDFASNRTTIATYVARAGIWLNAFDIWHKTGNWPGKSAD